MTTNNNKPNLNELDEYIKYIDALSNFDKYLEEGYLKPLPFNTYKGYLVNNKDYEELKKNINYSNIYGAREKKDYKNIFNSNKTMKLIKIKQIEFKTIRYLLNMLSNDNKFILITEELWDIIGNNAEKYHYPMEYKIDKDTLIIDLKEGKKLSFSNRKNNTIDKYNYNNLN